MISELNGWPTCALVNASPAMLPPPAHDSGLECFATAFPCGSLIRYFMPVLTGAFSAPFLTLSSSDLLSSSIFISLVINPRWTNTPHRDHGK